MNARQRHVGNNQTGKTVSENQGLILDPILLLSETLAVSMHMQSLFHICLVSI